MQRVLAAVYVLISSTNVLSVNLILATFISKTFTVELDEVAYPLSR